MTHTGKPVVLDLFSGCGGLSLGFQRAGCHIAAAIEVDREAALSHALNFAPPHLEPLHAQPRDITCVSPDEFASIFRLKNVDIIVGGPPCQAFSRVGRAKLRTVQDHPEAYKIDPRSTLYRSYLQYIEYFRPRAIVMENVIDILNFGGVNVCEQICIELERLGYECRYTTLNAVFYGVPQMRERMILLGLAKQTGQIPVFPEQLFHTILPQGYVDAVRYALRPIQAWPSPHMVTLHPASPKLPPGITAHDALHDLPPFTRHLEGNFSKQRTRYLETVPYRCNVDEGTFAWAMRNWPGFGSAETVSDHIIRYLPRDYFIFNIMSPGDQYPEAHEIALQLFEVEKLEWENLHGQPLHSHSRQYQQLFNEIVPPYDSLKFPNKWRKMAGDEPARTLMAHLGRDSYTHIHYDSAQARTISVREAARLQSFPDGFRFAGAMNACFRQIGNAVPPLFAFAIASTVVRSLSAHRRKGARRADDWRSKESSSQRPTIRSRTVQLTEDQHLR